MMLNKILTQKENARLTQLHYLLYLLEKAKKLLHFKSKLSYITIIIINLYGMLDYSNLIL